MPLNVNLSSAPAVEPVTQAEAKLFAKIDTTADDALVTSLIVAARQRIESLTRRALITQTWVWQLDAFPFSSVPVTTDALNMNPLRPPFPPLQSVTSITYVDTDGITQTWSSSDYTVDTTSEPGRIVPAFNESYPDTRDVIEAVTITYKAGYGDASTAVPDALITAVKMLTAAFYDNRDAFQSTAVPNAVNALISDYVVAGF